ncbi:hypothetical protein DdX_03249 [Ditylenchus destructor]|uniref:Uncharacterized protein n=1 Tax=Ditylenchus destructor TaxID=166010 RepID=A0AAD4RCW7_9BILA|nr:hypothetical protein DdX_03249 [Ditylenchus destructor]
MSSKEDRRSNSSSASSSTKPRTSNSINSNTREAPHSSSSWKASPPKYSDFVRGNYRENRSARSREPKFRRGGPPIFGMKRAAPFIRGRGGKRGRIAVRGRISPIRKTIAGNYGCPIRHKPSYDVSPDRSGTDMYAIKEFNRNDLFRKMIEAKNGDNLDEYYRYRDLLNRLERGELPKDSEKGKIQEEEMSIDELELEEVDCIGTVDESHHTDEDYNGLNNDDDEDIVPLDKDFKRDSDLGFPSSSKDEVNNQREDLINKSPMRSAVTTDDYSIRNRRLGRDSHSEEDDESTGGEDEEEVAYYHLAEDNLDLDVMVKAAERSTEKGQTHSRSSPQMSCTEEQEEDLDLLESDVPVLNCGLSKFPLTLSLKDSSETKSNFHNFLPMFVEAIFHSTNINGNAASSSSTEYPQRIQKYCMPIISKYGGKGHLDANEHETSSSRNESETPKSAQPLTDIENTEQPKKIPLTLMQIALNQFVILTCARFQCSTSLYTILIAFTFVLYDNYSHFDSSDRLQLCSMNAISIFVYMRIQMYSFF